MLSTSIINIVMPLYSPLKQEKFNTRIQNLYSSGKSMFEIALELNCSVHKVSYWMNKNKFRRRSRSDAAYVKANPVGDPFKIKTNLTIFETKLYGLGLGIYMGEGSKLAYGSVRVSNTNPTILRIFISFLKIICSVPNH